MKAITLLEGRPLTILYKNGAVSLKCQYETTLSRQYINVFVLRQRAPEEAGDVHADMVKICRSYALDRSEEEAKSFFETMAKKGEVKTPKTAEEEIADLKKKVASIALAQKSASQSLSVFQSLIVELSKRLDALEGKK